jgi:hypothetical protein
MARAVFFGSYFLHWACGLVDTAKHLGGFDVH